MGSNPFASASPSVIDRSEDSPEITGVNPRPLNKSYPGSVVQPDTLTQSRQPLILQHQKEVSKVLQEHRQSSYSQDKSVASPMLAPQPRRTVSQQLLTGHNVPSLPQVQDSSDPGMNNFTNPQLPLLDISRRRFTNAIEASRYLARTFWRPLPRSHGVPQTQDDRFPYVKKVYDAMIAIDNVLDKQAWSGDAHKFRSFDGVWGMAPADIEAVAHQVVDVCADIHNRGVSGLALGHYHGLKQLTHADRSFTFAQRIHWMALLLRHFKFHANLIMTSSLTTQFLARIWSTLWELVQFQTWWGGLAAAVKHHHLYVLPYQGVPATPMTTEERKNLTKEATLEQTRLLKRNYQHQQQTLQLRQIQTQNNSKRPLAAVDVTDTGFLAKRLCIQILPEQVAILEEQHDNDFEELFAGSGAVDFDFTISESDDAENDFNRFVEDVVATPPVDETPQSELEDLLSVDPFKDGQGDEAVSTQGKDISAGEEEESKTEEHQEE
jgi:hypothetical protein